MSFLWWSKLVNPGSALGRGSEARGRRAAKPLSARPALELLERRDLLSGGSVSHSVGVTVASGKHHTPDTTPVLTQPVSRTTSDALEAAGLADAQRGYPVPPTKGAKLAANCGGSTSTPVPNQGTTMVPVPTAFKLPETTGT